MESTLCAEVVEAKTNSIAHNSNIFFIVFVCWLSFFNLLSTLCNFGSHHCKRLSQVCKLTSHRCGLQQLLRPVVAEVPVVVYYELEFHRQVELGAIESTRLRCSSLSVWLIPLLSLVILMQIALKDNVENSFILY